MLLSSDEVVALCEKPAYAADLDAGRALERRHRLHIDGTRGDLQRFLTEKKPSLLASPEAFTTMLEVMNPASSTLYEGYAGVLNKVFTAPGGTKYFEFTDPALADDFQDYLADTTRTGESVYEQFATTWSKESLTGFQGVFLVDILPQQEAPIAGVSGVPLGLPRPYFSYIDSGRIRDMKITGSRIEYLILTATDAKGQPEYYCWDALYCHRVQQGSNGLEYRLELRTTHARDRVPAVVVTRKVADAKRPVYRTSPLEKSLNRADDYLLNYNWERLGAAYHANQKMWAYGLDCDYVPNLTKQQYEDGCEVRACTAGRVWTSIDGVGTETVCPRCNGAGKYLPAGPDKVIFVKPAPQGETSVVDPGPVGYIVPDLTSLEYLREACDRDERTLEKAVLGKSGILEMQTKAESGLKAMTDLSPLTDRLDDRGRDSVAAEKEILDLMASFRYESDFKASQVSRGRRYHFYDEKTVMAEFESAKKAGADASMLYALLEDAIYAKFASDPMELERALLKLELTPAPHLTVTEAQELGFIGEDDLLLKAYLNDFISRFERENGSILEFGSAISHAKKIDNIQKTFNSYLDGKRRAEPAPLQPTTLGANPAGVSANGGGGASAADATGTGVAAAA